MTDRSKQDYADQETVTKEQTEQVTIDEQDIEILNEEKAETIEAEKSDEEIQKLREEQETLQNRLLRVQADYENFKRRSNEEKIKNRKYGAQNLVEDLLPVVDNFQRGLDIQTESDETNGLKAGLDMVFRQLKDALQKEGVKEIDALGKPFDPNSHQAVMKVESDEFESNTVVEVLQSGYTLNDRVIRPAMVKVSS
ncbi:molecular chaperone GrpE [Scopulibacillus darangshiensis]|uniref:Protein GrpE n=1 Tax=Scopulibacillus darangshiensis TaxID=442528 RepID=A0A4R2PB51_9BACL|nr:nucleotide exchange factor GrpE [Scopulibacillus darangshiensis]TCP32333.1 molecular chaperone GrpE [Scopulibacillus darangshiensis]